MPEDTQVAQNEDVGSSPQPMTAGDGDLISTVEFAVQPQDDTEKTSSEETQNTEKSDAGDKGKGDESNDEGSDRFDKHPRFQQLISGNKELRSLVAQQSEQITTLLADNKSAGPVDKKDSEPDFKDLGVLSNEELAEMMDDNPKDFLQNFAKQVRSEVMSEVTDTLNEAETDSNRDKMEKTFIAYSDKHPDFDDMWDSGVLQRYIEEHPGNNAMSAHMALTLDDTVKAAVDAAIKGNQEEVRKNAKAKRNAQVLGDGPAAGGRTVGQVSVELQDTKKYGGLASVLTARSLAREAAP